MMLGIWVAVWQSMCVGFLHSLILDFYDDKTMDDMNHPCLVEISDDRTIL